MMELQSTETHNITVKKLTLFRRRLCDSYSTNQIVRFVNYCDGIFDSIEELKHSYGIEIRSRDSIIIPLMIEEKRAMFFTVSL